MATKTRHPLTSVLTEVVSEVAYLLQTEFRLARAEVGEKITALSNGGILLGAGALLILPGLVIALLAVVRWLVVAGLAEEWGLTIVGLVVLVAGGLLIMRGVNAFKGASLVPERTIEQVRADFSIAKEQV